uniref:CRAL-TRIO domain-containing protein n=1 Tax=Rhabditophanes sp. KR3021 TaxID=114890 RepID=A0AC35U640_9BILA
MAAYEKRFPTCPQIPIFVGCEVVFEEESEDKSIHVIDRKCQINFEIPYLVRKIAGISEIYCRQKNTLNRQNRTLLIEATNISFQSKVSVAENCNYYVHPDNEEWTCFEQSANLNVHSFFGFESIVEKLAVKHYTANLAKGKEIMQFFIDELIAEGITFIPKWVDPNPSESGESIGKKAEELNPSMNNFFVVDPGTSSFKEIDRTLTLTNGISTGLTIENVKNNYLEASGTEKFKKGLSVDERQLTAVEESRLCELKYGLQSAHKGKLPNDAHLLRFLRARDFDVGKARDMIINSLLWRKQHNVDQILQDFEVPPVIKQFFPGTWHHQDKLGRPLFVLRLGQMDVKGILRACGIKVLVKFILSICEEGLEKAADATKQLGKPISTWTLLVDLEGLSMRHLWRPGVQALLKIIEIVEAHYPETLGLVLVAKAPRVFPVLWTLVSRFINENTRKKIMINSNEHVFGDLKKYVDQNYLPTFLYGSCFFPAAQGGHVPKQMYLPMDEAITEEEDILTSTYITANVYRGLPLESYIKVDNLGCVITWDFDILKGECEFLLYHTNKVLEQPQPTSPSFKPVERVSAVIGSSSSHIGSLHGHPELVLDHDLFIVEKAIAFSEADSMQGSHYCCKSGTYIMQWRHQEPVSSHHTSFDFSLSGHKCRLMYYSELLNSTDFRFCCIARIMPFFI